MASPPHPSEHHRSPAPAAAALAEVLNFSNEDLRANRLPLLGMAVMFGGSAVSTLLLGRHYRSHLLELPPQRVSTATGVLTHEPEDNDGWPAATRDLFVSGVRFRVSIPASQAFLDGARYHLHFCAVEGQARLLSASVAGSATGRTE